MARREEWQAQVQLKILLEKWLDPACTFWTATDPVAPSVTSGAMRKKRGVKPGLPDTLILHRGKLVTLELKSRPTLFRVCTKKNYALCGNCLNLEFGLIQPLRRLNICSECVAQRQGRQRCFSGDC